MSEAAQNDANDRATRHRRHRNYSDAEKAAALAVLDFCEGRLSEASRLLGVPLTTLFEWNAGRVPRGLSEIRNEKKRDLAAALERLAFDLIDRVRDSAKAGGVDLGIVIDKMLLLRGQPTSISESRNDSSLKEKAQAKLAEYVALIGDEAKAREMLAQDAPTLSQYIN